MKKYDVIVIGAGPGGAHSARLLAKNNLNVLLLEKYKIPRIKPCAAGLPYHIDEIIDFYTSGLLNKKIKEKVKNEVYREIIKCNE